jgi:hypothetical protein
MKTKAESEKAESGKQFDSAVSVVSAFPLSRFPLFSP